MVTPDLGASGRRVARDGTTQGRQRGQGMGKREVGFDLILNESG